MSRFSEGDGFEDEEDEKYFYGRLEDGYTAAVPVLTEFLAYLDAMPIKRIIADRFVAPGSREMCAVAAFCHSRGFDWKKLLEVERDSRIQRMDMGEEENGGWEGPTVWAGVSAGLDQYVAHDLAWRTDMVWNQVRTGETEIRKDNRGNEYKHIVFRPLSPEERWTKLRSYIADAIDKKSKGEVKPAEVVP